ncbi:endoplasmic reticulum junction formation protein lunapark-B [Rhipicephalus sanguineus]|uniref:endoplasmic reticulum junction formation protein lunapark-B n=1 Tax=Rhipicephalus sanguineus TaxID=34632 RepID=UPI0020C28A8D|nr:endoplasmic reticulum junction formation protein lunapark-B [Rhipicephalus sanguineus]
MSLESTSASFASCLIAAFRCCYCFHWNQAKKQRPELPRVLELPQPGLLALPSPTSAAPVPAEESSSTVNNPSSEKDADETDMETCDEGFESKQAKEEAPPDDCLPAAKILPVDASGDILGPHEMARQPKQAVVAPLPKNPLSKKDD